MTAVGTAANAGGATQLRSGDPALRRFDVAMVSVGLAAFALLYTTQALLPDLGRTFGVSAPIAALSVSVTTGTLALAVLPMSDWAERMGRTRVMIGALVVACAAAIGAAVAPAFWLLLTFRGLDGVALAGVVAVAMGHIGSTVHPTAVAASMGVYVSGTSLGGLLGRVLPAGVGEFASWRWSIAGLAVVGGGCALVFAQLVPRSSTARGGSARERGIVRAHLRNAAVVRMCVVAFFSMGGFVAAYNYLTFRLGEAPFGLSTSVTGLVFLAYLAGTVTSTVAARLVGRFTRRRIALTSAMTAVAGLAVTLAPDLAVVLVGLVVFTAGFFGVHAVASGWTSALAGHHRSHAAALYLAAYYLGSALGGYLIGLAWSAGGWAATVACVAACFGVACAAIATAPERPVTRAGSPADPTSARPQAAVAARRPRPGSR